MLQQILSGAGTTKKKYHEDDDQKFAKDETRDDIPGMSVEVRLRCSIQQGTRLSDTQTVVYATLWLNSHANDFEQADLTFESPEHGRKHATSRPAPNMVERM